MTGIREVGLDREYTQMELHREHNESDSVFGRIANWFAARLRRSQTLRELGELDDRMLADIGLNRYDIPAAAAGACPIQSASRSAFTSSLVRPVLTLAGWFSASQPGTDPGPRLWISSHCSP